MGPAWVAKLDRTTPNAMIASREKQQLIPKSNACSQLLVWVAWTCYPNLAAATSRSRVRTPKKTKALDQQSSGPLTSANQRMLPRGRPPEHMGLRKYRGLSDDVEFHSDPFGLHLEQSTYSRLVKIGGFSHQGRISLQHFPSPCTTRSTGNPGRVRSCSQGHLPCKLGAPLFPKSFPTLPLTPNP